MGTARFQRLTRRFREYSEPVNYVDTCDRNATFSMEHAITQLMESTGELFHREYVAGRIHVSDPPDWFQNTSTVNLTVDSGGEPTDIEIEVWDTYWWYVVLWLKENIEGSGIVLPSRLRPAVPGSRWNQFGTLLTSFWINPRYSDRELCGIWCGISRACASACELLEDVYLRAQNTEKRKRQQKEIFPTPKNQDPALLKIDKNSQTVHCGEKTIYFGGEEQWNLFLLLWDNRGRLVKDAEIKDLRGRAATNVVGELKAYLRRNGGKQIDTVIKRQRALGYRLDVPNH